MIIFLLTFLIIYTGMHVLTFWGFHPLIKGHPALPTLTWIWMITMIITPVLVRVVERMGLETFARGLAWVGYSWMGVVFIAFSLFMMIGLGEILLTFVNRCLPQLPNVSLHGAITATVVLFIVIAASFYGLYEANNLQVERIKIFSSKLPPEAAPIRIVQISDLHLGLIHREEALAPVINQIQELHPDIVAATGDIVDAQINHLDKLINLWQRIDPPLGMYAVTGNHEYYAGLDQALDFLHRSGFQVLRNHGIDIGSWLKIAGVDDPARGAVADEDKALGKHSERFTLLLKHRPDFMDSSRGRFDLQISGHSHGGQIFPFNLLTAIKYPLLNGLYLLAENQYLYTNRGTGTWGPPMRIFSPPEITLFEIIPKTP